MLLGLIPQIGRRTHRELVPVHIVQIHHASCHVASDVHKLIPGRSHLVHAGEARMPQVVWMTGPSISASSAQRPMRRLRFEGLMGVPASLVKTRSAHSC